MNEKLIELIKKICIFLKKEDYYKLKKIINSSKDSYPDFFPLMHEYYSEKKQKKKKRKLYF